MSKKGIVERGTYYSIVQGSFRTKADEHTPGAVFRRWTSADGKTSGDKWELKVDHFFGKIMNIAFHDGEYGVQLKIWLDKDEETGEQPIIAIGANSREGQDFLQKLPNIDLSEEVRLRPFNFEGSEGGEVRGMEIMQRDENGEFKRKIVNYFRDTENKTNINGMPNPPKPNDEMTKNGWKAYFLQVNDFLQEYTEQKICPKFTEQGMRETAHDKAIESVEIGKDDIPF